MAGKYHILTMGCQMNKNDSERIIGLLLSFGLAEEPAPAKADLLIINTCSVRQSAEDRVRGMVKNWLEYKKINPKIIIALTGCLPGRDHDGRLKKKFPGVDLFFNIEQLPFFPQWLSGLNPELIENAGRETAVDYLNIFPKRQNFARAFITIQTGCNNFCSYCVVPYARGRERNRPVREILAEARQFAGQGGLEATLLGQVVNRYIAPDIENFSKNNPFLNCHSRTRFASINSSGNPDTGSVVEQAGIQSRGLSPSGSPNRSGMTNGADADCHFAALLWELNQIDGLRRIYFTAPDPQYFNEAQIEALKLPKLANYIHLPAQSGDNEILRKMNRKYTREQYIDIIKKIRAARPGIAIGTDLIVGFCGETDEQFINTLDLYRQCDFDIAYLAQYSERSGTAAAKIYKDDVPREIKKRRWDELQNLMEKIVFEKNQKYTGREVEVLVEGCSPPSVSLSALGVSGGGRSPSPSAREGGGGEREICSGMSSEMKFVQFLGTPDLVDKIARVKIFEAKEWLLKGELIE